MKKLKKWLMTAVGICAMLAACAVSASADVAIDAVNFPDASFMDVVKAYDTSGDGALQTAEIEAVTEMNIANKGITDLTGIEHFTNVTRLYCYDNNITSIDLNKIKVLTQLDFFNCGNNNITSLDLSGCSSIRTLYCRSNSSMTTLNLNGCSSLEVIECYESALTSLDVSGCTSVTNIDCADNSLTELNLSACTALNYINCMRNPLTAITFSDDAKKQDLISRNYFDHTCNEVIEIPGTEATYESEGTTDKIVCSLCDKVLQEQVAIPKICVTHTFVDGKGKCTVCGMLPIDAANFPSDNFRSYVLNPTNGINKDGDKLLSPAEIEAVTELDLGTKSCHDLTGIGYFTNLVKLVCDGNILTSLDLSQNTKLTYLDCSLNDLTSLDLSANTALTYLDCTDNVITEITFSSEDVKGNLISSGSFRHDCNYGEDDTCTLCGVVKPTPDASVIVVSIADDGFLTNPITYPAAIGEEFTVTAEVIEGYTFVGWYGADENEQEILLSENQTYTFIPTEVQTVLCAQYSLPVQTATVTILGLGSAGFTVDGSETVQKEFVQSYPVGTVITLNAVDSQRFKAWVNGSNKIIGTEPTLKLTVTSNNTVILKYTAEPAEGSTFVEYVSDYGQILQSMTYTSADEITEPAVPPSKAGHTFAGWSPSVEEIKAKIEAGEKNITVKPTYTAKETEYTVTVDYFDMDSKSSLGTETYQVKEGSVITLTAKDFDGSYFMQWQNDDDEVISAKKSCFALVTSNISFTAYYTLADDSYTKPIITVTNIYASTENGTPKLSFAAMRSVPDNYTVIENGLIYTTNSYDLDTFVLNGGDDIAKGQSNKNDNDGIYVQNIAVPGNEGTTVYARGYMIIKDNDTGKIETYYSSKKFGYFSALNQ